MFWRKKLYYLRTTKEKYKKNKGSLVVLICKTTLPSFLNTTLAFVTKMAACGEKNHIGRDNQWLNQPITTLRSPANQARAVSQGTYPRPQANFDRKHPADFKSDAEAGGRRAVAILVRFNERDEEGGKQVVNFSSGWEGRVSPAPD